MEEATQQPQPSMRPIFLDELPHDIQMLYRAIQSRIQLEELVYKKSVRTIYLQPVVFALFEEMVAHINEQTMKNNMGAMDKDNYIFMKVNIKKGTMLQAGALHCEYWAAGGKELKRQRKELKMDHLMN